MLELQESGTWIEEDRAHRPHGRSPSSTATKRSLDVSLGLFRRDVLTFVRLLPAFRHTDQKFRSAFLEVDLQGNQCRAFGILSLGQFADLFSVGEEWSYSQRLVLPMRSRRRVFSHMDPVQPESEGIEVSSDPPLREAGSAVTNGLDLRA